MNGLAVEPTRQRVGSPLNTDEPRAVSTEAEKLAMAKGVLQRARSACIKAWSRHPRRALNQTCPFLSITGPRRRCWQIAFDAYALAIGTQRMTQWNDAPGRTKDEVIAMFAKAIQLLEGGKVSLTMRDDG